MKTILVIEDNDVDLNSLLRLIRRYDPLAVRTARSVEEVRDSIEGADIIILDLKLPHKLGGVLDQEAGRIILESIKNSTGRAPDVVILSNYQEGEPAVSSYRRSEFPFVRHWFHKSDDREALSRYLAQAVV